MRRDPKKIIEALKRNGGKVRKTARELGLSPSTVMFWRSRARSLNDLRYLRTKGLARRSTAPKKPRKGVLSPDDRVRIEAHRRQHGQCALKTKHALSIPHGTNTIHRFLLKKGLVEPGRLHRRPRYQETTHMHSKNVTTVGKLQMDVKYVTPELSGLPHTLFLYAIMDIYSRYKQGVIFPLLDQGFAIETARLLVPKFPFKSDFIQTDNGLEFQERFDMFVRNDLKLDHHYIHKSSPNENAIIERSFRTDEEEFFFFKMQKPKDEIDLNRQYQEFIRYYNLERLHLGIDIKTPSEVALQKVFDMSVGD
jgi:transposase-like protein